MNILLSSAEETFLHVGSLISISILLFGYINYKTSGKFIEIISNNKRYQPLIGSIMGVIPGCGGSIILMPLFINGKVSFGTIVASLISSMGDSAFLLIISDFKAYITISLISLCTAIVTGYIVDILGLGKMLNYNKHKYSKINGVRYTHTQESNKSIECISCNKEIQLNLSKLENEIIHGIGYKIYLTLLIFGFILMILAHSGIEVGLIDIVHSLEEIIAILGIIISFIYMMISNKYNKIRKYNQEECELKSLKETITHSVREISFVIVWIFLAYIAYDIIILISGGEEVIVNSLIGVGVISVFGGAILGLIPGCGIQIIVMSFYLRGSLPFAALVANTISQDGDALFPLIAMNKKAAFFATLVTTIPAVIVGIIVYLI